MSEDRDRLGANEEPGQENDDVEAHVLRGANEEPGNEDGGDDVEAHILKG